LFLLVADELTDEYWQSHPELGSVPIYYASSLGKKCMAVYQTYTSMMNEKIRKKADIANPFVFSYIQDLKSIEEFQDTGPCVVMASPGMLQSGLSRQLFELWCQSKKNGVMIPGYCVEGTLAKTILSEPEEVETMEGRMVPLQLSVHYISFSAHSDFEGTSSFIDSLSPPNIILVHGEKNEMQRLQQTLLNRYAEKKIEILTPRNCQTVRLQFRGQKTAKAVGRIASGGPKRGKKLSGLLLKKDYQFTLVDPEDLSTYTKLTTSEVSQSQRVPYTASWEALVYQVEQMYDQVVLTTVSDCIAIQVHNIVYLVYSSTTELSLNWVSSPINDMIADSLLSIILNITQNPANFHNMGTKTKEEKELSEFQALEKVLREHYREVRADPDDGTILVNLDGILAIYHYPTKQVVSEDETFAKRITEILKHAVRATATIPTEIKA